MAKNKVYAVHFKDGTQKLFHDWSSCEAEVKGKGDVLFKGFPSLDEAENWLSDKQNGNKGSSISLKIFVDGAFRPKCQKAGWGWVAVEKDVLLKEDYGLTPENALSRNIDGELQASVEAANWAQNEGKKAVICHDYAGIEHWATGEWKAKSEIAQRYVNLMKPHRGNIFFEKIKAHSGNQWNDWADKLANRAIDEYLS